MTAATTRLYYDDAYLLTFEASVTEVRQADGHTSVALDRSAFYPTSGGQGHDTGHLTASESGRRVTVVDVVAADDGVVWHVLDAHDVGQSSDWRVGLLVHGAVDDARRADHRQQHSGQHVLSASFARVCHAETRSVHLGAELCTLDLDTEVTPDDLAAAEAHANSVVLEDRPVQVRQVDGAVAASLPLRRPTSRSGTIRLVEIDGHDLSACGGTHVARTGEIGAIVIRAAERFKGGMRVSFVCGQRAVDGHRLLVRTLDATARLLSVAPSDVPAAVARLLDEGRETRRALDEARLRISAFEADALGSSFRPAGDVSLLVESVAASDPPALRRMATTLVEADDRVVVLIGQDAPHAIVVARSANLDGVDAGAIARAIAQAYGGKAGGRPDVGQGGGLTTVDLESVRARLTGQFTG